MKKKRALIAQCKKCKMVQSVDDKGIKRWMYAHVTFPTLDKVLCYPCSVKNFQPNDELKVV